MNVSKLRELAEKSKEEIDRLLNVIETPELILSDFYDAYSGNLLQHILEFMNVTEDELYNSLIEQLGKMKVLSNCKITKIKDGASSPLLISYRKPEFRLFLLDIKGKKYENVFESVVRGLKVNITEAEAAKRTAEAELETIKEVSAKIHQLSGGDDSLRGFAGLGRKKNIRKYLGDINYTKEEIERILQDLRGFRIKLSDTIDKRQALLAEAEMDYSEAIERRREYEDNAHLQNAVNDLNAMLVNSGYEVKQNLGNIPLSEKKEKRLWARFGLEGKNGVD